MRKINTKYKEKHIHLRPVTEIEGEDVNKAMLEISSGKACVQIGVAIECIKH